MDGGRVLRSLLARWRPEDEATRISAATGQALAILIGLFGLLSLLTGFGLRLARSEN